MTRLVRPGTHRGLTVRVGYDRVVRRKCFVMASEVVPSGQVLGGKACGHTMV